MDLKKVDFNNYQITLEKVMEQFDSSGKEMYEDIVEELLEDAAEHVKPYALWRRVTVHHLSQDSVKLNDISFSSSYLVKRLEGVEEAFAFVVTIGEELWECRNNMSDALEQYLFDAIMKTCLDSAFARTAEEIVLNLPDKMGLYMDNPGHLAGTAVGWDLADQKQFLKLFKNSEDKEKNDGCKNDYKSEYVVKINDKDLFETSYSLSGIIYAKGKEDANCVLCPKPECSHRKKDFDGRLLVERLHNSAE